MYDLQVLALQADLTRVITFQMAREASTRTYPQIGVPEPHHPVSHHVDDPEKAKNKLEEFNWDLGFHRTKIIANGGITNNNGKVGVVNMGQIDFDDVKEAPSGGYIQDSRSFGSVVNKGIADWYNYRTRTHNVESRKNVYVVKSSEDEYIKIRILNYYCSRDEKDCRTIMCTRAEAACLTIEYVLSDKGTRVFPISTDPQLAQNNQPGYP